MLGLGLGMWDVAPGITLNKGGGAVTPSTDAAILVVFGQSNSRAAGTSSLTATGALAAALGDILIWRAADATPAFQTYQARVNSEPRNAANSWGSEAAFALAWKAANPGVPLYIVKYGVNGTQLVYSSGLSTWTPGGQGSLYTQLKNDLIAAKAALVALGKTPRVIAALWCQGEAEAFDNTGALAAAYATNLTALDTAVHTELGDASTKFIIERIRPLDYFNTQGGSGTPYYTGGYVVRDAQVAAQGGNTITISADVDDFVNIHPDQTWVQHKGERSYAAYAGTYTATYGDITDAVPSAFTFTDATGATAGSVVTSNLITPTGFQSKAAVSITGGQYQTYQPDGVTVATAWTSSAGFIQPYQSIKIRQTASATGSTTTNAVLTIGGVSDTWSVTTEAAAPSYQTETTAFLATMAANGGATMDGTQKAALDAFYVSAKARGYWAKRKRLYVGGLLPDAIAASIDLFDQTTSQTQRTGAGLTNVPWTANQGWNPAGVSSRGLDLKINPSTDLPINGFAVGAYFKALSADTDLDVASSDSTISFRFLSDGTARVRLASANINLSALTTTAGFRLMNVSAATAYQIYGPAGTSINSGTRTATTNTSTLLALGTPGASGTTADRPLAAHFAFNDTLTVTDVQNFRDDLLALLTDFGSN